jgi:hypothetical protein
MVIPALMMQQHMVQPEQQRVWVVANLASSLDLGSSFTNVPGGTANWSFSNPNYVAQSGSVEIAISKATTTITTANV